MKPENLKILLGFEWEAEYNTDKLTLYKADYHSDFEDTELISQNIKVEEDGSLDSTYFEDGNGEFIGDTAEFVTQPINLKDYKNILNEFKTAICRKSGCNDFQSVLNFNNTTGAHLHFSLSNKNRWIPIKLIPFQEFDKLNEKILEAFKNNFPEEQYQIFKKHYYRSYAMKDLNYNERYCSINFTLCESNHLELRSFHLRHCWSWDDFFKSYAILIPIIEEFLITHCIKKKLKYSYKKEVTIVLKPNYTEILNKLKGQRMVEQKTISLNREQINQIMNWVLK